MSTNLTPVPRPPMGPVPKNGWRTANFGDCARLVRQSVSPAEMGDSLYIGLEHIGEGTLSLIGQGNARDVTSAKMMFRDGDILFGKLRPYFRKVVRAPSDGICSTDIWVVRAAQGVDQNYLYYCMASDEFIKFATGGSEGTKMPRSIWEYVSGFKIRLPSLPEQRAIAQILGALDDKIELNRRMNETLEQMSRVLFKSWFMDFDPVRAKMDGRWQRGQSLPGLPAELYDLFPARLIPSELGEIPEGWEVKALDEIADFRNGLALQKLRPAENEERLPVVKIAQLRTGKADGGEWAKADIADDCIIDDGDVVFSWSGSLMIKVWCGGPAALNQHLFKVTSRQYPKWFYLHCTESHLPAFQAIAAGKTTTMGHIKREHLKEAICAVPDATLLSSVDERYAALLSKFVSTNVESRTLSALRDSLLPKLVNGELRMGGNSTTHAEQRL